VIPLIPISNYARLYFYSRNLLQEHSNQDIIRGFIRPWSSYNSDGFGVFRSWLAQLLRRARVRSYVRQPNDNRYGI